jgi:hypothetical protein
MLSHDDRKIIEQVLNNEKLKDKLLNDTLRGEYARGKGMMGGKLQTVMNTPIQQGLPSISAVGSGGRIRKLDLDDLEGEGIMDFIKKAIDVGKSIYNKVAPFVDVAKKGFEIVGTTKDAIKNLQRKPGDQTGYGMKKAKMNELLKTILKKEGGRKVKNQVIPMEVIGDMEGSAYQTQVIGERAPALKLLKGGRKVNKWIQFLQSQKVKVKDIPKKGTEEHKKFMKQYDAFKSR